MTELPAEIQFGKVTGRFMLAVGDGVDPGSEPDAQPAIGTVRFEPRVANQKVLLPEPTLVTSRPPVCDLDAEGYLVDSQGNPGVWLLVGSYDVVYNLQGVRLSPMTITVTEDHTELTPLELPLLVPNGANPLTPSEYAELLQLLTTHDHDGRYYTQAQVTALLAGFYTEAEVNALISGHNHDSRYYTEAEVNALISGHNHDSRYYTEAEIDAMLAGVGGSGFVDEPMYQNLLSRDGSFGLALSGCRPSRFVKTYTVRAGVTQSVPLGLYPTIQAAITQCNLDIRADWTNVTADQSRGNPDRWRQIVVEPGTYNEQGLFVPDFCSLVSSTGDWRDVRVWHAGDVTSGALLQTGGATCHVRGINFDFTGTDENWHPWRDNGPSGNADYTGGRQRRTVIVEGCQFLVSNAAASQGCAGMDAVPNKGAYFLVHNNRFIQDNGVQVINLVTNMSVSAGARSIFAFVDNYVRQGHLQRAGMDNPVGGLNDPASPVGLVDGGGGRGDLVYWIGGTFDIGNAAGYLGAAAPGTQAPVTPSYQPFGISGATQTTRYIIDPDLPLKNLDGSYTFLQGEVFWQGSFDPANQVRSRELPDLPVNGVAPEQDVAYGLNEKGPSVNSDNVLYALSSGLTPAKAALTANRVYFVRYRVDKAFPVGRFHIGVGAAGAKGTAVATAVYADDGTGTAPSTDTNMRVTNPVLTVPTKTERIMAGTPASRRPFYPYHKYVWVAFVANSATPTFDTSTTQTDNPVLYVDGWAGAQLASPTALGALSALPGGTAFPIPEIQHYSLIDATVLTRGTAGNEFYAVPKNAKALAIKMIGGGGGGGSGCRGAAGVVRSGGGGGAGGVINDYLIPTSTLGSLLIFAFAAPGLGGAAVGADSTNGASGGGGAQVTGSTNSGAEFGRAGGGAGGAGGAAAAVTAAASSGGMYATAASGVGGITAVSGNGGAGGNAPAGIGAPGGGGGGSISSANAAGIGGAGGTATGGPMGAVSAVGGGANTGGAGTNGPDTISGTMAGHGGSGGGANLTGAGGAGGNGGNFGAGGGGGGASVNGNASGKGGDGGWAAVVIVPIF